MVLPVPRESMRGKYPWELRVLQSVVLPEGVTRVKSDWFMESRIESVTVSASVRELGTMAFFGCERLYQVTFVAGSRLQTIGERCFCGCGLK